MKKTDILDVASRKLVPYMFLFGFYLVTFGTYSPGGGFQGGVVIASGVILLSMARGTPAAEVLFPFRRLQVVEVVSFGLLLAAAVTGMILTSINHTYIIVLNVLIGIKVAAGTSLICLALFRGARR